MASTVGFDSHRQQQRENFNARVWRRKIEETEYRLPCFVEMFFWSILIRSLRRRRWNRAFRTHIEEMHVRLKNGDIHVQISNATSRALTGDMSLSVGRLPDSVHFLATDLLSLVEIIVECQRCHSHRGRTATIISEEYLCHGSDQLLRRDHSRSNQWTKPTERKTRG